jgi:hypothetical protein
VNFKKGDLILKEFYKCEIDGKVFESQGDCLKHEFELKGGKNNLKNIIDDAFFILEDRYKLTFEELEYDAYIGWDQNPNTDRKNYVEYQKLKFNVLSNGTIIGDKYDRGSSGGYSVEEIVRGRLCLPIFENF